MKRKLIDINDETFEILSADAISSGTNLKQYIESLLVCKARELEDGAARRYSFSMSREPSDDELNSIMKCAAESVKQTNKIVLDKFFSEIRQTISKAR